MPSIRDCAILRRFIYRFCNTSIEVLGCVFRGKFVAALRQAFAAGKLGFHGQMKSLAQPKAFSSLLRQLFRHLWVVYSKRPFGGPEYALRYLGRYTPRVAISNHRLVAFVDGQVTFRWRDSAHKNKKQLMTLPVEEFLRRFLLHLLPRGYVRIRHFGSGQPPAGGLAATWLGAAGNSRRIAGDTDRAGR
jgi:hypothetical protein